MRINKGIAGRNFILPTHTDAPNRQWHSEDGFTTTRQRKPHPTITAKAKRDFTTVHTHNHSL